MKLWLRRTLVQLNP